VLILSIITLAIGAAAYAWRARLRAGTQPLDVGARIGPERGYAALMTAVNAGARRLTRLFQNGYLRHYLLVTVTTAVVLIGLALIVAGGVPLGTGQLELRATEVGLAALILIAAFVAVRSGSRLGAVAALGVAGFGVALVFLSFGAPDLAMTQVLIETLTVIVFVLVLVHLPGFGQESSRGRLRDAIVSLAFGGLMTLLTLGALHEDVRPTIATFFGERALVDAHGRNVVNVVLVDFRALDTMGEIAVLALAGLGVLVLLRLHAEHRAARR
jgi:multicomponent Na+:H+ antiporter subunit A